MAGQQGLGSDNMSQKDKDKIHKMGGESSHSSGGTQNSSTSSRSTTTNRSGGGGLDKEAQKRGGQNSKRT